MTTPVWPYPQLEITIGETTWKCQLSAHEGSGQWRKRHKGRDYYFGPLHDPDEAMRNWMDRWPYIVRGESTPQPDSSMPTAGQLFDEYVASRKADRDAGDIGHETYLDATNLCNRLRECIASNTPYDKLNVVDWERVNRRFAKYSPAVRRNMVTRTNSFVKWANARTGAKVETQPGLSLPKLKSVRRHKREAGPQSLTREQILAILDVAAKSPEFRAMVLLGINCGMGNTDVARLPAKVIRLDDGWIDYPRPKTEADRRAPLWPETVEALRPFIPSEHKWVFATKTGACLVRQKTDLVARRARTIFDLAGAPDASFYWLRRTFATVAAETGDEHASKLIMGHVIDGVHEGYIQKFADDRLLNVTNHVRAWLFGETDSDGSSSPASPEPETSP